MAEDMEKASGPGGGGDLSSGPDQVFSACVDLNEGGDGGAPAWSVDGPIDDEELTVKAYLDMDRTTQVEEFRHERETHNGVSEGFGDLSPFPFGDPPGSGPTSSYNASAMEKIKFVMEEVQTSSFVENLPFSRQADTASNSNEWTQLEAMNDYDTDFSRYVVGDSTQLGDHQTVVALEKDKIPVVESAIGKQSPVPPSVPKRVRHLLLGDGERQRSSRSDDGPRRTGTTRSKSQGNLIIRGELDEGSPSVRPGGHFRRESSSQLTPTGVEHPRVDGHRRQLSQLTRRDSDLPSLIRRLEAIVGSVDDSARISLRDALLSLSIKANNPYARRTSEQEAIGRAAEYLVLRMLFMSGPHQVMYSAPGTPGALGPAEEPSPSTLAPVGQQSSSQGLSDKSPSQ